MLAHSRDIAKPKELVKPISSADVPATHSLQLAEHHVCVVAHRLHFEALSSKLAPSPSLCYKLPDLNLLKRFCMSYLCTQCLANAYSFVEHYLLISPTSIKRNVGT